LKNLNALLKRRNLAEIVPDFVVGDFDSDRSSHYFKELSNTQGSKAPVYVSRPSQDMNDFEKSLEFIRSRRFTRNEEGNGVDA